MHEWSLIVLIKSLKDKIKNKSLRSGFQNLKFSKFWCIDYSLFSMVKSEFPFPSSQRESDLKVCATSLEYLIMSGQKLTSKRN